MYVSSYYLPIKPIENELYFTEVEFNSLMSVLSEDEKKTLTIEQYGARYFVKFTSEALIQKYSELTVRPYWFKVNVFYDVGASQDFIILSH